MINPEGMALKIVNQEIEKISGCMEKIFDDKFLIFTQDLLNSLPESNILDKSLKSELFVKFLSQKFSKPNSTTVKILDNEMKILVKESTWITPKAKKLFQNSSWTIAVLSTKKSNEIRQHLLDLNNAPIEIKNYPDSLTQLLKRKLSGR
jgi:hypothetical protein